VVPVFNGERFLAAALDSVFEQAYEPVELVVVDDGSTDRSGEIAAASGARLIRREHGGISAARNAGVGAARGELIAFLDADDLWLPNKLSIQVGYLLGHPEVDFVRSHTEIFLEPCTPPPPWFREGWLGRPQHGLLQTLLASRQALDVAGPFDPAFEIGEDIEWLARAKDAGLVSALLPDVLARLRVHAGSTMYNRLDGGPALVRALKASLDRRRSDVHAGGASGAG
jgi:glycosyltransferase involved in cell wall biosynthesis